MRSDYREIVQKSNYNVSKIILKSTSFEQKLLQARK